MPVWPAPLRGISSQCTACEDVVKGIHSSCEGEHPRGSVRGSRGFRLGRLTLLLCEAVTARRGTEYGLPCSACFTSRHPQSLFGLSPRVAICQQKVVWDVLSTRKTSFSPASLVLQIFCCDANSQAVTSPRQPSLLSKACRTGSWGCWVVLTQVMLCCNFSRTLLLEY